MGNIFDERYGESECCARNRLEALVKTVLWLESRSDNLAWTYLFVLRSARLMGVLWPVRG